ncbi:MAG: proton-conducting transporter membrane subunit [Thermoprotei archaeon]
MIIGNTLCLAIILIPGLLPVIAGKRAKGASIVGSAVGVVLAVTIYFFKPATGLFFVQTSTAVFIAMTESVYFLSTLYSIRYLKAVESWGISEYTYYSLLGLFNSAMVFSLGINNYGLMWVGIEATTIASALLLMTEKTDTSLEATWRYIVIASAGVAFAFISVILIYYAIGTLTVSVAINSGIHSKIMIVAVALALVGFGTKVGVFPVHTWLPDAHSEAPSPVSAMLSGVLLPTALYVLYRVYEIEPLENLYVWFAVISIAAASLFMTYQVRYKRMFAYSTMENMNLALLGFAVGGTLGLTGALLLLVSHSFGKAGAFYSSGNILRTMKTKMIDDVGGMSRSMPYTSTSLLLSSLAVTGTPPFGTFFGELLILTAVFLQHLYTQFIIVIIFLVAAFVSVNYNVTGMVFGDGSGQPETDRLMEVLPIVSSVLALLIGIVYLVVFFT